MLPAFAADADGAEDGELVGQAGGAREVPRGVVRASALRHGTPDQLRGISRHNLQDVGEPVHFIERCFRGKDRLHEERAFVQLRHEVAAHGEGGAAAADPPLADHYPLPVAALLHDRTLMATVDSWVAGLRPDALLRL